MAHAVLSELRNGASQVSGLVAEGSYVRPCLAPELIASMRCCALSDRDFLAEPVRWGPRHENRQAKLRAWPRINRAGSGSFVMISVI
jgi:hypothetical protein